MWIAIEYSYKLSQKSEFKFWCELGWFLQRQSHIPELLDKIERERTDTTFNVKTKSVLPADHPARIQRTIGHSEPPMTTNIVTKTVEVQLINISGQMTF